MTGKLSFIDEAANEFSFGSDERSRHFGHSYQKFFSVWFPFEENYMLHT